MPERDLITGIPGVKVRHYVEEPTEIIVKGEMEAGPDTACPRCQQKHFRIKATRLRHFKHAVLRKKLVRLKLRIPKLFCKTCHHCDLFEGK